MRDFPTNGALEAMTYGVEFQLRKHGHYGPHTTVEEAVNAMTNFELLTLVADYLDAQSKEIST